MGDAGWNRLAAGAGILGLALTIVGFLAGGTLPSPDDSGAQIADYLVDQRSGLMFSAFAFTLAIPFIFWFFGSLRGLLAQVEGGRGALATMFITTVVILITLFAVGALVLTTLAWRGPEGLGDADLRLLYGFVVLATTSATSMASASSVIAPSIIFWRTGVLPRWISLVGVAVVIANVFELFGIFARTGGNAGGSGAGMFAVPLWTLFFLATSITLFRREESPVEVAA